MIRTVFKVLVLATIPVAIFGLLQMWSRYYDIAGDVASSEDAGTLAERTRSAKRIEVEAIPKEFLGEITIPILGYHQFEDVPSSQYAITPTVFQDQMEYLRSNGFHTISLGTLADYISGSIDSLPAKPVVITVDDGWRSGFINAVPILIEKGFTATFFVYTDFISSGPNSLSWKDLKDLLKQNFDVGSHTKSHRHFLFLRKQSTPLEYKEEILKELRDSKKHLENKLGISVTLFSYPYGIYDSHLEESVREHGYRAAVTTNPGPNSKRSNSLRLSRFIIFGSHTLKDFARMVTSRVLLVEDPEPKEASTIRSSQPMISVRITDKSIDTGSLRMKLGETLLTAKFDSATNRFSCQIPESLKNTAYIVSISAKEKMSGKTKFASWLFVVDTDT